MPELPEVDHVRHTLGEHVIGRLVQRVRIVRPDIITGSATPKALLQGQEITTILRHGKQLAIIADPQAPCVCVHLGMTGQLQYHRPTPEPPEVSESARSSKPTRNDHRRLLDGLATQKHIHILWQLDDGGVVTFRDPRRFGGLWTFASLALLQSSRWAALGPDALTISPKALHDQFARTRRPVKAALLDQALVAGLGNIYVDECLFAVAMNPSTPACELDGPACRRLAQAFKAILKRAIASGGSTIRNYADSNGQSGRFQATLRVYGRGGLPCVNCGRPLITKTIIGRTSTLCQYCQGG